MVDSLTPFDLTHLPSKESPIILSAEFEAGNISVQFDQPVELLGDLDLDLWRVNSAAQTFRPTVQPTNPGDFTTINFSTSEVIGPPIPADTGEFSGPDFNLQGRNLVVVETQVGWPVTGV